MKIWFIIIIFFTLGYLFLPYTTQLLEYVNFGFGKLSGLLQYLIRLISISLNTLISYNYIFMVIAIFVSINVIFYIIDLIRGDN